MWKKIQKKLSVLSAYSKQIFKQKKKKYFKYIIILILFNYLFDISLAEEDSINETKDEKNLLNKWMFTIITISIICGISYILWKYGYNLNEYFNKNNFDISNKMTEQQKSIYIVEQKVNSLAYLNQEVKNLTKEFQELKNQMNDMTKNTIDLTIGKKN